MTIFVITCIEKRGNHRKRTVEWRSTLELAIKSVLHNSGDMSEGQTNHWAVIEETKEGFPFIDAEYWFEWVGNEGGGYQPCPKPEFFRSLMNWGIG